MCSLSENIEFCNIIVIKHSMTNLVLHSPVGVWKTRLRPLKIRTYSRTSPIKILNIQTMSNEYDGEEFSLFLQTSIRDLFSLHFEKVRAKVASVRLIGNPPATFLKCLWIYFKVGLWYVRFARYVWQIQICLAIFEQLFCFDLKIFYLGKSLPPLGSPPFPLSA